MLLTALCRDDAPEAVADVIGDGGAAALKEMLTTALNDRFAALRARRAELAADPGYLRDVLAAGNERARLLTDATLHAVRKLMHTSY